MPDCKLQNNGTQPLIGNLATTFSGAFHHVYYPVSTLSQPARSPWNVKLQNTTVVGVTDYYSRVVLMLDDSNIGEILPSIYTHAHVYISHFLLILHRFLQRNPLPNTAEMLT